MCQVRHTLCVYITVSLLYRTVTLHGLTEMFVYQLLENGTCGVVNGGQASKRFQMKSNGCIGLHTGLIKAHKLKKKEMYIAAKRAYW